MKTTLDRQSKRNVPNRNAVALGVALGALAFAHVATATIITLSNSDGDWNTASHWSPAQVPTSVDTVRVRDSRTTTLADAESGAASVLDIGVSIGAGGNTGTLNVLGTLDIGGNMRMAYGHTTWGGAKATVNQGPSSSVSVGGNLTIGRYHVYGDGAVYLLGQDASLDVTGNLILADTDSTNFETVAGALILSAGSSADVTGNLQIGGERSTYTSSYGQGGVVVVPETATLRLLGASSSLNIATGGAGARGRLDYDSTVGTLDIGGNVTIASGHTTWGPSTGTLDQGAGSSIAIGGNLTVGSAYSNTGDGGVVNLAGGARLTIAGATAVASGTASKGSINIQVEGESGGLDLLSSATLSVGTSGLIDITFAADPLKALLGTVDDHNSIYYGLKWAGNHVTDLTTLGTKLAWDDTTYLTGDFYDAASVFYDPGTDATYVGFYMFVVPEPSVLALLVVGGWLLRRAGQKAES